MLIDIGLDNITHKKWSCVYNVAGIEANSL